MAIGTNFSVLPWGLYPDMFSVSGDATTWSGLVPPFQAGQTKTASNPWNPTFLQELAHYDTMRSMDLVGSNSTTQPTWSARVSPNTSPLDGTNNPNGILAYEWLIDLANRSGTNLWINVPATADANYLSSLATLVIKNLQARSGLTLYVEWANEDWWEPVGHGQAKILGNGDATMGTVIGSMTAWQAFETALTASGRTDIKLMRVLGGQCGNNYLASQLISDLTKKGGKAEAFAIAPYVGSAATVTSSDFASEYEAVVQQVAGQYAIVHAAGMDLVGYEGGQNSNKETQAVTDDPAYYEPYAKYLQGLNQYMTLFNHFMHSNGGTSIGWAAELKVGDVSSQTQAYRVHALFDWNDGAIPVSGTVPSAPAQYNGNLILPTVNY